MSFLTGLFGGSDSSATTPTAVTPAATSNTGGGFMDTLNSWDNSFNEWSNNAESGINSWFGNLFGGNDPDNTVAKATNTDTNGPSLGDYVSEGAQSFTQGMNQGQSQAQAAPLNVQATQPMQVAQLQASPMMAEQTPLNNEAVATPAPAPAPVQSLAVVQPTQGMVQSDPNAQLGAQIAGVATPTQTMGQPGAIQPQQVQATQQQQNAAPSAVEQFYAAQGAVPTPNQSNNEPSMLGQILAGVTAGVQNYYNPFSAPEHLTQGYLSRSAYNTAQQAEQQRNQAAQQQAAQQQQNQLAQQFANVMQDESVDKSQKEQIALQNPELYQNWQAISQANQPSFTPSKVGGQVYNVQTDAQGRFVGATDANGNDATDSYTAGVQAEYNLANQPTTKVNNPWVATGWGTMINKHTGEEVKSDYYTSPKDAALEAKTEEKAQTMKAEAGQTWQNAEQTINLIDDITSDESLGDVIGPWDSMTPTLYGSSANVESKLAQLHGQSFLAAFQSLKGAGAITDAEGQRATGSINRIFDNDGNVRGGMSETDVKNALGELKTTLKIGQKRAEFIQKNGREPNVDETKTLYKEVGAKPAKTIGRYTVTSKSGGN